jgi:hypothetical protein
MLILGFLGMYFDAAMVFVTKSLLFFRLAVAILCKKMNDRNTFICFYLFYWQLSNIFSMHFIFPLQTKIINTQKKAFLA